MAVCILAGVSGCASTTLVSSQKTEGVNAKQYTSLLIVGMSEEAQTRQVFEEIFSDALRQRGIKAVSSYTFASLRDKPSRADFVEALKKIGADGLLSSQLLDVKVKKDTKTGYVMTDRGVSMDNFYDYYGNYWNEVRSYATFDSKPVDVILSRLTTTKIALFDASNGKITWSGTSNETRADKLIASTKTLAHLVLDALTKENLLYTKTD